MYSVFNMPGVVKFISFLVRDYNMHAAVFVLECCGLVASRMQSYGPAAELHQELLINYNPEVRPRLNPSEAVDVETILELNQLINVDSKKQQLTMSIDMVMIWYDDYLKWNSSDYGNITETEIDPIKIWVPDIQAVNRVAGNQITQSRVQVTNAGLVFYNTRHILEFTCLLNMTTFPHDKHECSLFFASWSYSSEKLRFTMTGRAELNTKHSEFRLEVTEMKQFQAQFSFTAFGEVLIRSRIANVLSMEIRREPSFVQRTFIYPLIAMSSLTLLVFLLPTDSSAKLDLLMNITLAYTLFVIMVADVIPSSENVPGIVQQIIGLIACNSTAMLITILMGWMVNIPYRPTPGVFKVLVAFGRCLLVPYDGTLKCVNQTSTESEVEKIIEIGKTQDRALLRLVMMIQTWKAENDEKDDIKEQWLHIATVLDRILLIIFSIILSSVAVRLTTAPPME